MEVSVSPQTKNKHIAVTSEKFKKDIWFAVREGSLTDVESSLLLLKKSGGYINSRNAFGLTPLHIGTWRNHIPIVRRLLAAGADPDARDGESGWSSLHRALHFGHLAVASVLLQHGASILLEDTKSRTPVDLLSGPVLQALRNGINAAVTEVYTWGSGANYQLGTGNAHLQKLPCKVDALHGSFIKLVSAAKFHSVAVSTNGEVYTWGFGRGGRLGHPDFDIHSGQAAVITPRLVTTLSSRRVKVLAAAKHHTVLVTDGGEVFTWGSNREGQLGYTGDTQPTPRRVSSLKVRVVAVAAANKHTAVVSETGEIYTWGCNKEGQLGYGTSNSASNYTPRVVDYLKNKAMSGVSAAKSHTIALGVDGEVYTWGHRMVTPKRVSIVRNMKRGGITPLKFHRMERLHVSSVAAGVLHSLALTEDGALFCWLSNDPDHKCRQLDSLSGKTVTCISAGKCWSAVVTNTGDVFMLDSKKAIGKPPTVSRVHGVKRATAVSVGETHMIIVSSLYHCQSPTPTVTRVVEKEVEAGVQLEEFDEGFIFEEMEPKPIGNEYSEQKSVPSLKSLCEKVAMEIIVEPRNAIQMLEIADSLDANELKKHCEDIAIHNLDYILTVSLTSFMNASPEILASLETLLDKRSSEPWSYRRLPTPTATLPVVIEEDIKSDSLGRRGNHSEKHDLRNNQRLDSFLQPVDNLVVTKQVRSLRKKLQQISMLEEKQSSGYQLDDQQLAKLLTKKEVEACLAELGCIEDSVPTKPITGTSSTKGCKKPEVSKKQKKKERQKLDTIKTEIEDDMQPVPVKSSFYLEDAPFKKEEETILDGVEDEQVMDEVLPSASKKSTPETPKVKSNSSAFSKKKNKKGGLSMFLSGALDTAPEDVAPPALAPKNEGPAWGGAKLKAEFASLREIQDEQSRTKEGKFMLSSLMSSKPIPVVSVNAVSDVERSTPPWASGTPPLLSRPSFRDIQMQQKGKKQQSLSHSPQTRTAGFAIASPSSPSDSPGMNRWFKPEIETPTSSIRSIQIEEKAIKDLKRFYNSVKLVKNQT